MTDKVPVMLRVPKEVHENLKKAAAADQRSVNNLLEVIIGEYLKNNGFTDK